MLRSSKLFVVILVIVVLATSAYAFTTNNSVPVNYAVSNISYAFDTANPSNLTTVAFDLDNPAATVKVSLTTGGALQDCTSATPFTHWTCTLTDTTVSSASALRMVITQ